VGVEERLHGLVMLWAAPALAQHLALATLHGAEGYFLTILKLAVRGTPASPIALKGVMVAR
jgi:hypothetical protein